MASLFTFGSSKTEATRKPVSQARVAGLQNGLGEQNCFLNVVIQALWRLESCRNLFMGLESMPLFEDGKPNYLFEALWTLFNAFQFSEEQTLPPDRVRLALAEGFEHMDRFKLGQMDDAGESFEGILSMLHGGDIDSPCKTRHACLGHNVFALTYAKEDHCESCEYFKTHPEESCFAYRVYAQEVINAVGSLGSQSRVTLAEALQYAESLRYSKCPKCSREDSIINKRYVLSQPAVLCLNIIWPGIHVERPMLEEVLDMIGSTRNEFRLNHVFDTLDKATQLRPYSLSGMICFYPGSHYVYFGRINGEASDTWALFDDSHTKPIGNFDAVIDRCLKAKYHPVAVFFEQFRNGSSPRSHDGSIAPPVYQSRASRSQQEGQREDRTKDYFQSRRDQVHANRDSFDAPRFLTPSFSSDLTSPDDDSIVRVPLYEYASTPLVKPDRISGRNFAVYFTPAEDKSNDDGTGVTRRRG